MAIDNLNYMSSGLPAGQLTDKYSSQPGCLKSKNLDIFSSSKSVKATAWSEATSGDSDIIKEEGGLTLKTDGIVYQEDIDGMLTPIAYPAANFPVYKVSYNGANGTYADAEWGTVQDMSVAVEGDEWKSYIVYSDRASYVYSKVKYTPNKEFKNIDNLTLQSDVFSDGYCFKKTSSSGGGSSLEIAVEDSPFSTFPVRIYADQYSGSNTDVELDSIQLYVPIGYYYDAELDAMVVTASLGSYQYVPFTGSIRDEGGITVMIPTFPTYSNRRQVKLNFRYTQHEGVSNYAWSGDLYIDMNGGPEADHRMDGLHADGDFNGYYTYLPIRERKLQDIGEYYWMKGSSFQPLYTWESSWVDVNREKKTRYDFVQYAGVANDPGMDVIGMIVWNEQVYMIGNMKGNGYIIPCDLAGSRGTPYIAYGCEFKGVANIDYLLYLVGENRGISNLWVFNQQELVPVIGGNKENLDNDLVGVDEQYKFDGKIVNWRKNLILTTKDNRIFQYGQTYGGKGGSFIHQLPSNAVITGLKANGNDLEVDYSITVNDTTTNYSIKYQDDIAKKRYNTEWEAVYPIVLGNHILEKEESDLFTSFILPSAATKLEFWGMANHYHFWTFTSADNVTLSGSESYKISGTSGTYALKFIERNDNQYTFRLEGDLPVITTGVKQIIDSNLNVVITYSDFNHFRRIGIIETDKYWEGDFRFHNLNNKLELPKSHSLQIMVKGKGTTNYTPELFSVDLVANQRERG